jgi:DmsE family decaheme c-type cytochrome
MIAARKLAIAVAFLSFFVIPVAQSESITELDEMLEKAGAYMGSETCAECHRDHHDQIEGRKHGVAADPRSPMAAQGCETCHGPGGSHLINNDDPMVSFKGVTQSSTEIRNAMCTQCHQNELLTEWHTSIHASDDVACVDCHAVHKPDPVLERTTQADVCYACHQERRAQSFRAFRHPTREGKVICSDCHNPHGSQGPASLKQLSVNENCYTCHAEKRGPFLWEHDPVTEDCSTCHQVHGSSHPAMLVKQGPQLCQSCHLNATSGLGATHIGRANDMFAPQPAPADNRGGRFVIGQNCTNCHSQVHGSNHPSGAGLQR